MSVSRILKFTHDTLKRYNARNGQWNSFLSTFIKVILRNALLTAGVKPAWISGYSIQNNNYLTSETKAFIVYDSYISCRIYLFKLIPSISSEIPQC